MEINNYIKEYNLEPLEAYSLLHSNPEYFMEDIVGFALCIIAAKIVLDIIKIQAEVEDGS